MPLQPIAQRPAHLHFPVPDAPEGVEVIHGNRGGIYYHSAGSTPPSPSPAPSKKSYPDPSNWGLQDGTTKSNNTLPNGDYTPERHKLHRDIVDTLLKNVP